MTGFIAYISSLNSDKGWYTLLKANVYANHFGLYMEVLRFVCAVLDIFLDVIFIYNWYVYM